MFSWFLYSNLSKYQYINAFLFLLSFQCWYHFVLCIYPETSILTHNASDKVFSIHRTIQNSNEKRVPVNYACKNSTIQELFKYKYVADNARIFLLSLLYQGLNTWSCACSVPDLFQKSVLQENWCLLSWCQGMLQSSRALRAALGTLRWLFTFQTFVNIQPLEDIKETATLVVYM